MFKEKKVLTTDLSLNIYLFAYLKVPANYFDSRLTFSIFILRATRCLLSITHQLGDFNRFIIKWDQSKNKEWLLVYKIVSHHKLEE